MSFAFRRLLYSCLRHANNAYKHRHPAFVILCHQLAILSFLSFILVSRLPTQYLLIGELYARWQSQLFEWCEKIQNYLDTGGGNYNVFIPELNENETDGGKFKNLGMKKMEMENFTTSRGIRSNFFLFSFFFCRMEL